MRTTQVVSRKARRIVWSVASASQMYHITRLT